MSVQATGVQKFGPTAPVPGGGEQLAGSISAQEPSRHAPQAKYRGIRIRNSMAGSGLARYAGKMYAAGAT
jgi:hypothetical protein